MSRPGFDLVTRCLCASALSLVLVACGDSGSPKTTTPPTASGIKGGYVFHVSGTDSNDGDYSVVGSFVADGNGNITSGVADYNLGSGVDQNVPLTGTYTVSGGTATINLTDGASVKDSFSATLPGAAVLSMPIQNFDGSGSGNLFQQTTSGYVTPGTYSFSVTGEGQGTITGSGQFVAGASGAFTGGNMTFTDAQTSTNYTALTGFLSAPLTSGRGQAALEGSNFAYYVVGPNQILMLGLNDQNLLYVPATKQ